MGKSLSERLSSIKGRSSDEWISESYREFGNKAGERPQRKPQSQQTPTPEPKTNEFAGFAGMEPERLTALRGLADKQLNPGARAKFLQNALTNFQKQQTKPAAKPEPEPTQPKEEPKEPVDVKKVASALGSPKASAPAPRALDLGEPNPQKEGEPSLDDILGDIRGRDKEPIQSLDDVADRHEEVTEPVMNDRAKLIQEFKERLGKSFDMEDEADDDIKPYRDWIKSRLGTDGTDKSMRDQFVNLMALANTYDGRVRNGEGKRSMTYEDAQVLLNPEVQKGLLEGYGDGSPDQIEKFIQTRKLQDTDGDSIEALYKILPKAFKQALGSGNLGTTAKLMGEDGNMYSQAVDKLHFGGDDKRVGSSSVLRKKLLLKLYMDQMGRDGYTGRELDPRYMELEHVRGLKNLQDGEDNVTLQDILNRENSRNWLWTSTGVNNEKSDLSMQEFLDNVNKKHSGKTKADYVDLDAADEELKANNAGISSLLEGMFENKDFSKKATPDALQALFDNELAESKEMHRGGIKKTPVQMGDKIRKALGLVKDRKLTRSQIKTQKELFRPLIMKMAGMDPEARNAFKEQYNSLFHSAGDRARDLASMGDAAESESDAMFKKVKGVNSYNEKGTWENLFYRSLSDNGLLSQEDLESHMQPKELAKFKKLLFEDYDESLTIDDSGRFDLSEHVRYNR